MQFHLRNLVNFVTMVFAVSILPAQQGGPTHKLPGKTPPVVVIGGSIRLREADKKFTDCSNELLCLATNQSTLSYYVSSGSSWITIPTKTDMGWKVHISNVDGAGHENPEAIVICSDANCCAKMTCKPGKGDGKLVYVRIRSDLAGSATADPREMDYGEKPRSCSAGTTTTQCDVVSYMRVEVNGVAVGKPIPCSGPDSASVKCAFGIGDPEENGAGFDKQYYTKPGHHSHRRDAQ